RALKAASGTLRPRPVRCGPILRLKKRSGRRVAILPPSFHMPVQGSERVFHTAGNTLRSPLRVVWTSQSNGRISCQSDGSGRGVHGCDGGSGVEPSGVVFSNSVRMATLDTPFVM